ncbi:MAG: hypothetical protein ACLFR1_05590 [Spirochaetia bacterium]
MKLGILVIGGKLCYRLFNEAPPVTQFEPYPFDAFQFSIFGALSS